MIKQVIEKKKLDFQEIRGSLELDKTIFTAWYDERQHSLTHFSDYFKSDQTFVVLRARKKSQLLLWDSSALIPHCMYNDALNVRFQVEPSETNQALAFNLKTKQGNQGFILRKSQGIYDLTYYFSLLQVHATTGELLVSPCVYYLENPDVSLSLDGISSISELLKTNPLRVDLQENQLLCFDKFHYQIGYNPDVSFVCISKTA